MAHGGTLPQQANDLTVVELAAAFMRHARGYYRRPDGKPTDEVPTIRSSRSGCESFTAAHCRRFRSSGAQGHAAGHDRRKPSPPDDQPGRQPCPPGFQVGRRKPTNRVQRVAWSASRRGLAIRPQRRQETAPVKPVPDAFVDAVLPHVSAQVAAMIELQRVTGMRTAKSRLTRMRHQHSAGLGFHTRAAQNRLARSRSQRSIWVRRPRPSSSHF